MEKVRIGLLGFGNIGRGVWDIIQMNNAAITENSGYEIEISKILVQSLKDRGIKESHLFTTNVDEILDSTDIEIVIELIGGLTPARDYILKALKNKKHVVTANKAVIASFGDELLKTADDNGVYLYYEASVAGGIPILDSIRESLAANQVQEIMGIINGTTNYILTKMTGEGMDFKSALLEAQEKGYAEADPSSDVDGYDAAYKLSILSSLAFNTNLPIDAIFREGISRITPVDIEYAKELGFVIKLLAIGKQKDDSIELRVHPTLIPSYHPLAAVNDVYNGIFIKGNAVGNLMYYGRGAGALPTGSAVVGNVISILKRMTCRYISPLKSSNHLKVLQPMNNTECEYYIRIMVKDIPGVLGKIATRFGSNNVSLSTVLQKGEGDPLVSLVFITHNTVEERIQSAIKEIQEIVEVSEIANIIRVENHYRA